ncbi:MAG: asnB [Hyphomicrobiales bacterium]|nr:asnB [Hyphomicrobiales bacterium]
MCGINGIFAFHYAANPIDRAELLRTRDHMKARGPDGCGAWVSDDERVALGHRRLAIIELSEAGAQPMHNADGRFVVTFNGEIYNFQALRRELEDKGYIFRSHSDTEVLLHLYADRGAEMVHALRGMFAFCIWDNLTKELFLARDPYGIKPIYYADDGWTFRFASQVKALLASGRIGAAPEPAGHVGFYLFGSVPEPFTTYREIRALPAGTTLLVNGIGAHEPRRYHSIAQTLCLAETEVRTAPRSADLREELREALLDSVRHHLVADVPVGAFLSAGIDSSALVALMRNAGQSDIKTVTLQFAEFQGTADDEAPIAAEVARLYGVRHTIRQVSAREFQADLPRILEAMDQPSIDGINTWFVSKAARECGLKVAISGLGGDELFGGYPSFKDIPRWESMFALPSRVPLLGKLMRVLGSPVARVLQASPKAPGLIELGGTYAGAYLLRRGLFMPWELEHVLDRDFAREGMRRLAPLNLIASAIEPQPASAQARVSALESSLYMRNQLLRDTDWASMAHSLEVRVPLVDATLLSKMARVASASQSGLAKSLLAEAPSPPLPASVKRRPKTGFTTPIAVWQQTAMRELLIDDVPPCASIDGPWARRWASTVLAA